MLVYCNNIDDYVKDVFANVKQKNFDKAIKITTDNRDKDLLKIILLKLYSSDQYINYSFKDLAEFIKSNPKLPFQSVLRKNAESLIDDNTDKSLVYEFFSKFKPLTRKGVKYYVDSIPKDLISSNKAKKIIQEAWHQGSFNVKEQEVYLKEFSKFLSQKDHLKRAKFLVQSANFNEIDNIINLLSIQDKSLITNMVLLKKDLIDNKALLDISTPYLEDMERKVESVKLSLHNKLMPYSKYSEGSNNKYKYNSRLIFDYCTMCRALDYISNDIVFLLSIVEDKNGISWWPLKCYFVRENITRGNYLVAYNIAKDHHSVNKADVSDAEWLAGWIALRFLNKPMLAKKHFLKFLSVVSTPISQSRGYYWLGRSYKEMGMHNKSHDAFKKSGKYNYTFYGMLALKELAIDKLVFSDTKKSDVTIDTKNSELLLVKKLIDHDPDLAIKLAISFLSSLKDNRLLLNYFFEMRNSNSYYFNLEVARFLYQKLLVNFNSLYPAPLEFKSNNSIDQEHLYAVIRIESGFGLERFDPKGKSPGLMQLIPSTAKEISLSINIPYDYNKHVNDIDYNILLGTKYLSNLNNLYNESLILVSCGYNAGSHRVNKWINKYGDPRKMESLYDVIDWIELIPFNVTRNYVQRIIETIQIYKVFYSNDNNLIIDKLLLSN